jgi:heat shock protein HslJ
MLSLNKRLIELTLGVVVLVCAACTPQSGPLPNTGDGQALEVESNLANSQWKLVSFGEADAEKPVIDGSSIVLEFEQNGQAGGSGGCNSYSARYEVQGNQLSFGEITRTLRACEQEGITQQEQNYFQALEVAGRFELDGDHLAIWYDGGQGVLNYVKLEGAP